MYVLAKFKCLTKEEYQGSVVVGLWACTSDIDPNPDNASFWEYTPAGNLSMTITNESAFDYFVIGDVYTLTFDKEAAAAAA